MLSNPKLTALITTRIGDRWISIWKESSSVEPFAVDVGFQQEWRAVKADNKRSLAAFIQERTGITVNPQSLFDIQVKRLHEYKRQHLNVLYLITLYNQIKCGAVRPSPRAR